MKVQKLIHHKQLHKLNITGATLLCRAEVEKYLTQEDRKYHNWWWLRPTGYFLDSDAYVINDGSVLWIGNSVFIDNGCVRPVLMISNLEESGYKIGDIFEFGNKKFKITSDYFAFCLGDIGKTYFDKTSPNYETSHIKEYVDNWFNANKK